MSWFAADSPLFPEIIALHGKWQGAKPAVVDGDRVLSWREFDLGANRVANGLRSLGLTRGDRVAVLMHNSLEMLEAIWGVLKAGGVVVPLNLSITDAAVIAMLADCAAVAVIASDEQCQRVEMLRSQLAGLRSVACIACDAPDAAAGWHYYRAWRDSQSPNPPVVALADDDECNIIYSSGNHRPAQGHRPYASPAPRLGVRSRHRAALPLRRTHALLARPLLEHQLGRVSLHAARRRHGRGDARVRAAGAARDRRARADHARRDGAVAVPAHPRTVGLRSFRRRARCAA